MWAPGLCCEPTDNEDLDVNLREIMDNAMIEKVNGVHFLMAT